MPSLTRPADRGHARHVLADAATARRARHDLAVAHVDRALTRYSWLSAVDREMYVGIVEQWLQPLPPDRPWTHRRLHAPRGEASWVGGRVGMHLPAPRESSS